MASKDSYSDVNSEIRGYPPQQQQGYGNQGYAGQQQQQSTVAVGQPATVIVTSRPNNYLGFAICTCICCFWPTGIAAIVFACMSQSSSDRNDFAKAQEEGNLAKILSIVSLVIGLIWIIAVIIYVIVLFTVLAEATTNIVNSATGGSFSIG